MIAGPNRIWQNNLLLFPLDIIAVRQIRQFFLGKIVFHAFIVYIVIRLIKGNIELREIMEEIQLLVRVKQKR